MPDLLTALWAAALLGDLVGLGLHLCRWRWRQRVLGWARGTPHERRAWARRNNEIFRSELKALMVLWAVAVLAQRLVLGPDAPSGVLAWLLWGTHAEMLILLTLWTYRER